jgi:hypothetical protein
MSARSEKMVPTAGLRGEEREEGRRGEGERRWLGEGCGKGGLYLVQFTL